MHRSELNGIKGLSKHKKKPSNDAAIITTQRTYTPPLKRSCSSSDMSLADRSETSLSDRMSEASSLLDSSNNTSLLNFELSPNISSSSNHIYLSNSIKYTIALANLDVDINDCLVRGLVLYFLVI